MLLLALHDWIALGKLHDVEAVPAANPGRKRMAATLISLTPLAIGLTASALHFGRAYPAWLFCWLWISYGLLFIGELTARWTLYLFHAEPERTARYQVIKHQQIRCFGSQARPPTGPRCKHLVVHPAPPPLFIPRESAILVAPCLRTASTSQ
jgi:hypothetical protein